MTLTLSTGPSTDVDGPLPGPLTHSEMQTFRTCRRRWHWAYRDRYSEKPGTQPATGVAQLGTNIHACLEGHYTGLDAFDVLAVIYDDLQDRRPEDHHAIASERSYAFTMVKGYLEWVAETGVDAQYGVVATEADTRAKIWLYPEDGGGDADVTITLRGKLDQVVERRDGSGARLVRDFKTVGTLSKADDLVRDTQMRTYDLLHWMSQPHKAIVDGVLYTMLLRSKRTAKATPPFYAAVHMGYNTRDRQSALEAVRGTALDIMAVDARLAAGEPPQRVLYANPGAYCAWACPFVSVCHMADDGSRLADALEDGFVRADPWDHYGTERMDSIRRALGGTVKDVGNDPVKEGTAGG